MTPTRTPPRGTLAATLTDYAPLPAEVRRAPRQRQEQKMKASYLGLVVMLVGVAVMGVAAVLVLRPQPSLPLVAMVGGFGAVLLALGGLVADRETFGPALAAIFKYGVGVIAAKRGS